MISFDEIVSRNTPEDIKYGKIEGIDDLILSINRKRIAVIKVPCLRLEAARAVISASGDEQGNADAGAVGDIRFLQSAAVQR